MAPVGHTPPDSGAALSDESAPAIVSITASAPGNSVDLSLAISDHPDPVVRKQSVADTLTIDSQRPDVAQAPRLAIELFGDIRGAPLVESCSVAPETMPTRGSHAVRLR